MKPYIRLTDPGVVPITSDKEARKLLKENQIIYGAETGSDTAIQITKVGIKYITTIAGEEIYSECIELYKVTDAHVSVNQPKPLPT